MKYCPQCGQPGDDNQKFCMSCGADVSASPTSAAPYYPPQTKKKSDTKIALIILACVFAFMAIPFVLIVAAIAIPNLLRARISANESAAVAATRTIVTAAIQYQSTYNHYPESLDQMGSAASGAPDENHAALLDNSLASGTKGGYLFTFSQRTDDRGNPGYEIHANPITPGTTGRRYFYANEDAVVRADFRPATAESPPLGGFGRSSQPPRSELKDCRSANAESADASIFLAPVAGMPCDTLDQLAAHYQQKFAVTVAILPPVDVTSDWDVARGQFVAEKVIASMQRAYPDQAADPKKIVIGITDKDIYPLGQNWAFCFGWRDMNAHMAVVSTARMSLHYQGEPSTGTDTQTRVQKIVTKDLGIMYFGKQPNNDPHSVLYNRIGGIQELDQVSEDF